jgi:hypothetical protein
VNVKPGSIMGRGLVTDAVSGQNVEDVDRLFEVVRKLPGNILDACIGGVDS